MASKLATRKSHHTHRLKTRPQHCAEALRSPPAGSGSSASVPVTTVDRAYTYLLADKSQRRALEHMRALGRQRGVRVFETQRLEAGTSVRCNEGRIRRGESWHRERSGRSRRSVRAVCGE